MPIATERYRSKYLPGNYARITEGLGAYNEQIEKPYEVVSAIQRGIVVVASERPAVLEFITKPDPVVSR